MTFLDALSLDLSLVLCNLSEAIRHPTEMLLLVPSYLLIADRILDAVPLYGYIQRY